MNYIILDMEWDSAYSTRHKRFINQILQIGAVKLNEQLDITDEFEVNIRSSFSKKVSGRFAKLTGITSETMLSGIPLDEAVSRYNKWIGDDTVTMTWSTSDLFSIIENEALLLDGVKFKLQKYLDLQKFIQNELSVMGNPCKSQISLANAAELLSVDYDSLELHTAKDDSILCAMLLKKCYVKERFEPLIRDTSEPSFYKRLLYKPHYIDDINSDEIDRSALVFNCDKCASHTKRITKWKYINRWFIADFRCRECNRRFSGRVSFKKSFDEISVKRKICEPKVRKKSVNNEKSVVKNENEVLSLSENVRQ